MAGKNVSTANVSIPSGITLTAEKKGARSIVVSVNGPKGKSTKEFKMLGLDISVSGNTVSITGACKFVNTLQAHINNMINGVANGYSIKMKVLYSHFPVTLSVKDNKVEIKNFVGRKASVFVPVIGDTKVDIKGQDVIVTGYDKESVGQTAANIRNGTKIRGFDPRVFQDGIYYSMD